jgi:hypothetical protein
MKFKMKGGSIGATFIYVCEAKPSMGILVFLAVRKSWVSSDLQTREPGWSVSLGQISEFTRPAVLCVWASISNKAHPPG